MSVEEGDSLRAKFHSCSCCQQILLDFSDNGSVVSSWSPALPQSIILPMPFDGSTTPRGRENKSIRRINEFLSSSAHAGCLFSRSVLHELSAAHAEDQPVKGVFSWIGGIEFIGASSSYCLLNYYWCSTL